MTVTVTFLETIDYLIIIRRIVTRVILLGR